MQIQDEKTKEFLRLLKTHDRELHGCILALVADWAVAEDILQETCVRLWEQFDQYRHDEDFGVWARVIARYQVRNYFNKKKREPLMLKDDFVETIADGVEELASEQESRRNALAVCLKRLQSRQLELIQRCYAPGATIKSVADAMGRPLEATYKAVQRIRAKLHECVESRVQTEWER